MKTTLRKRLSAPERRASIINAAIVAFARDGYDATTMDGIAERARISKPVLYDHFASKQALFLGVLESIRDGLISEGRTIAHDGADLALRFRRSINTFFEFVEKAPDAARVLLTVPSGDPVSARISREVQAGASAGIATLLAENFFCEQRQWQMQCAAEFLKAGLHAVAVWWLDNPGPSRPEIVDMVFAATWPGTRTQTD